MVTNVRRTVVDWRVQNKPGKWVERSICVGSCSHAHFAIPLLPGATFQPQTNSHKSEWAEKASNQDVVSRLYNPKAEERKQRDLERKKVRPLIHPPIRRID